MWQCTVLLKKLSGIPMHRVLGVFFDYLKKILQESEGTVCACILSKEEETRE